MFRPLILGGTTEASRLAQLLAAAGINAVFSYAGRTNTPIGQPLPLRIGGFGGVEGLVEYLREERVTHVIDATHPFAAQISANVISASAACDLPLVAVERPAWQPQPEDSWIMLPDFQAVVDALPKEPARVFLAIGRQNLEKFSNLPHHWLLRLVNPPDSHMPLKRAQTVIARGPFSADEDEVLLRKHRITHIVAKNSGGSGGQAKLIAARRLKLPIFMVERPRVPQRFTVETPEEAMTWLHQTSLRGV